MKSPFPGMDPFLEVSGLWQDFHDDLINEIKRSLSAQLPERYFVQTGERSYIVLASTEGKDARPFSPDVGVRTVTRRQRGPEADRGATVAEAADEAVTMRAFIDEHFRENFIEIYEAGPELRLVTCIEVLSPSNKRPGTEGWEQYLRNRNALLLGNANLVEIDLLRGGRRMPMVEPWPASPYYLLVGRQSRVPYCRVYPAYFDRPLPVIPVPLDSPDPDLSLALQPMIEAVYERSRYGQRLDYSKPLDPPLAPEQAAWLQGRLSERDEPKSARPHKGRRR